jgi:DNA-binding MarR family transcriptional regulator
LLDRMQTAGLIERERSGTDRRVVEIRISRKGLEALGRLDKPVAQLHRRQFDALSGDELREFRRLLGLAAASAAVRSAAEHR